MRLFLYTAPLRAQFRVGSIEDAVEVPDALAAEYIAAGIARAAGGDVRPKPVAAPVEQADAPVAERADAPAAPAEEWTFKLSPEQYLERFPEGPASDLARSLLNNREE